ncbi:vacuolar sorting protein VPS33/slp1 [Entophlyctis luteolus]|nr:vacuolar sorting protein VPS33/slp1 [Entophlyctis luteolus]KAJ3340887.1 vacuolar sorting protein VPS33/slp1 [Entophlyctis luteolus]KAJ3379636.1 vacuolar sorting protein VPS33/slp1 [Entophlyctis sp. JEL0112]
MADILEENVTLVEDVSRNRTSYPTKEAIYFISPIIESVTALINDFTRPKPMYAKAHVFFTAPEIESIARKLVSVFSTLGEKPLIRYHNPTGHPPEETPSISYRLAATLQRELDNLCEQDPDFPPKSQYKPPVLIILDRSFDLMSPLVHEFTYQAMLNDLLVMEDGKYVYQAESNSEETPKTGSAPPQLTKAVLDDTDAIWMLIRHWHYVDAVDYVRENFNKFLSENKAAASMLNANSKRGLENLNDMKDTISSLPQFQELKAKYSVHINICQECKSLFERRKLDLVAAVEQDLATGETSAGTAPRNIIIDMTPVLIDQSITAYDKLRILMLYIIAQEGIHDMDRKRLLDAAKLSLEDSQAITNLGLLGVRLSLNQEKTQKLVKDKYTYYGRVAEKRKKKKKKNDSELPYDLSRFVTMLKYILEDQLAGTLDTQLYPWIIAPTNEDPSAQAKASGSSQKPSKAAAALQPLPSAGNPYSLRTTRASWAVKTKTTGGDIAGGLLSGGVSGGGATGQENDLRKNGSRTVVFIMGGATFSEIRACYEIIKEYKRDVILGSTSIINATQFINVMKKIHIKDDKRATGSVDSSIPNLTKSGDIQIPRGESTEALSTSREKTKEDASKEKKAFSGMFNKGKK